MELNTVQEIERAVAGLPPQQLAELYAWLDQYDPQPWLREFRTGQRVGGSLSIGEGRLSRSATFHKRSFVKLCLSDIQLVKPRK